MSSADNRWIISRHHFKEHHSFESAQAEFYRLATKFPDQHFEIYRIKRTKRDPKAEAEACEMKAAGRWRAVVYRTEAGTTDVEHFFDEMIELHWLVERGPHWDTIVSITTTRINHVNSADLTVERAAQQ
jgi:hypothetical protein